MGKVKASSFTREILYCSECKEDMHSECHCKGANTLMTLVSFSQLSCPLRIIASPLNSSESFTLSY